jgi:ribonuclease HI
MQGDQPLRLPERACVSETQSPFGTGGVNARLSTDGGARGNPGPAAYAYVLEADDGTVLAAHGEAIGVATNNVAEYSALVAGLEKAIEVGVTELEVISDSELMVKQMRGEYRVKNEALRDLSVRASQLAREVGSVSYKAVRREQNKLADQLVNEALDAEAPG